MLLKGAQGDIMEMGLVTKSAAVLLPGFAIKI